MHRHRARTLGRLTALAVVAAGLAAPVAAHAATSLQPEATVVEDVDGNGVVAPGDGIRFWQDLRNLDPDAAVPGFTATVTATNGATVGTASAPYAQIAPGGVGRNTTPFTATVPAGWTCGRKLTFSMSAGGGTVIGVDVPTGLPAASVGYDSADVPYPITAGPATVSTLDVGAPDTAIVKDVRVHLDDLRHTWDADLTATLRAPDGTTVPLFSAVGGSGDNFIGTELTSDPAAPPIAGASAPFTGTYRVDALSRFEGAQLGGQWRLQISDGNGSDDGTLVHWGLELSAATCDAQAMASLRATPNPVAPGATVTLDASGSRTIPGRTITAYDWDFDNDGTWDRRTTGATTTTSYPVRGQARPRVRITDSGGGTATTSLLLPVTTPPTAALVATPANPMSGDVVHLDASASRDAVGKAPARYQWDLDGDGVFERDGGTVATYDATFPKAGTRTVHVRVTDDLGATAQAGAVVTVGNRAPQAAITAPSAVATGATFTVSAARSSDADGTIAQYAWDLDNDGQFDDATTQAPTTSFATVGSHRIAVRVTDDLGATGVATADIYASNAPVAALTADPLSARPGQTIHFDASGSRDPDTSALTYAWDLDGDGTFEVDGGSAPTLDRGLPAGRHTVAVRVTGDHGVSADATVVIDVVNSPPTAVLRASTQTPLAGQAVTFDASSSVDPDGSIVDYRWDLNGDGLFETATQRTATVTRTYPNAGPIRVAVQVTDNDGVRAVARLDLSVQPAPGTQPGGAGGSGGSGGSGASGSSGGSGGSGGGYGGSSLPGGRLSARLGGAPIQSLLAAVRRGIALTCGADRAVTCTIVAKLSAATARRYRLAPRRGKPRAVVIGRLTLRTTGARQARGVVRLTKAAKRRLRRARSVSVIVQGRAADAAGNHVSLLRAALLRR